MKAQFAPELVSRYNVSGARYTSYPTANVFHDCTSQAYMSEVQSLQPGTALSLYLHVPFCSTICYYCACNKINTGNHKHADTYVDHLVREMSLQAGLLNDRHPVEQMHFGGGTPTFLNDAQFARVFEGLHANFSLIDDPDRDYSIEIDPRRLPPERIATLAKFGLNRMSVGVQDFDPTVQEAVNRIQSEAETADVIHTARALGFRSINVDLIYGLPLQNHRGFARTLDRILALDPDRISLYNYAHLPERFKTQRQIRSADLPSASAKLDLLAMAVERFGLAGYEYVGMDHFAKPTDSLFTARKAGTLHRNFQGYTTHGHCALMALGVSAISKVGKAYAQNAKTLDAYYEAILAGRLATDRGYVMTADDDIAADVIQKIMCDLNVDIDQFNRCHGIDFWQYFEHAWESLSQMAEEGLIDLQRRRIEVTAAGRFLVRNICMVFDAHLSLNHQGFSKTV